jgi:hypothetical protein
MVIGDRGDVSKDQGPAAGSSNGLHQESNFLAINRMLGDELLPEDSERNADGTLKQWPLWLLDSQPSPTGRFTFTSWRLGQKDQALQPSGLLGPVAVRTTARVDLK